MFINRFYDVVFKHSNDSAILNLSCGRVMFENKTNLSWWSQKEHHWKVDPSCQRQWHMDGMTCVCKQVGTYALLRTKHEYKVSMCNKATCINNGPKYAKMDENGNVCISPGMGSLLLMHFVLRSSCI